MAVVASAGDIDKEHVLNRIVDLTPSAYSKDRDVGGMRLPVVEDIAASWARSRHVG